MNIIVIRIDCIKLLLYKAHEDFLYYNTNKFVFIKNLAFVKILYTVVIFNSQKS